MKIKHKYKNLFYLINIKFKYIMCILFIFSNFLCIKYEIKYNKK